MTPINKTLRLVFLMAIILLSASCTKEDTPYDQVERNITYIVTDNPQEPTPITATVHLYSDEEYDALLDRFCDWAKEGSTVTFYNADLVDKSSASSDLTFDREPIPQQQLTATLVNADHIGESPDPNERATYSTTDRESMKRWMREQEAAGMTVTVTYDPNTGIWTGTSYPEKPKSALKPNIEPLASRGNVGVER